MAAQSPPPLTPPPEPPNLRPPPSDFFEGWPEKTFEPGLRLWGCLGREMWKGGTSSPPPPPSLPRFLPFCHYLANSGTCAHARGLILSPALLLVQLIQRAWVCVPYLVPLVEKGLAEASKWPHLGSLFTHNSRSIVNLKMQRSALERQ